MAKGTPIAALDIEVGSNITAFLQAMKTATGEIQKFGKNAEKQLGVIDKTLKGLGGAFKGLGGWIVGLGAAFGTAKLIQSFNQAAEVVDKLGKSAKRLGVDSQSLSALRFAAGEAGVEFETLAKMAGKAGKNIAEMVKGGANQARLGQVLVDLKDAGGEVRNIGALLPELARGIESAGSQAEKLRLAEKFFGREGGQQFVTWLEDSGNFIENLATQTERARRLGVLFTEEQVRKLTEYNDAVGRITEAWLGLRVQLMTQVAPELTKIANQTASILASVPSIVGNLMKAFGDGPEADQVKGNLIEFLQEVLMAVTTAFKQLMQEALVQLAAGLMATAALIKSQMFGGSFAGSFFEQQTKFRELIGEPTDVQTWLGNITIHARLAWEALDRAGKISEEVGRHSMDVLATGVAKATGKISEFEQNLIELADAVGEKVRGLSATFGDALGEMVVEGKAAFDEIFRSFAKMLVSMAAQKLIFDQLFGYLGKAVSGTAGTSGSQVGDWNQPGFQTSGEGMASMGRWPSPPAPVAKVGKGGGVNVQVFDQRGRGQPVQVQESTGPDGQRSIRILIRDEVRGLLGSGGLDDVAGRAWGVRRIGVAR